jgi:hypothetical protein
MQMFSVYGGKCLLHKAVHNWVEKFSQGHSKVADDARQGRSLETVTEATLQWMEEVIRAEEDNDRQCSNCTRVFPWFSIQHNAWSFEVSENVHLMGA